MPSIEVVIRGDFWSPTRGKAGSAPVKADSRSWRLLGEFDLLPRLISARLQVAEFHGSPTHYFSQMRGFIGNRRLRRSLTEVQKRACHLPILSRA
jgi:hypothetical protein